MAFRVPTLDVSVVDLTVNLDVRASNDSCVGSSGPHCSAQWLTGLGLGSSQHRKAVATVGPVLVTKLSLLSCAELFSS